MKPRSLVSQSPTTLKLTTGCETLDECLRGGFPCDSLTEIVAESGCGKTQLCLQLSAPSSRFQTADSTAQLSISTPSSPSRFAVSTSSRSFHLSNPSIYADHNDNPCDHVFVQNVHSVDHLFDVMPKIESFVKTSKTRLPLKLIVLDSVAALFRSEFDNTPSDLRKSFLFSRYQEVEAAGEIGNLRCLYSSGRRVVPALGLAWANCVNSRVFISRSGDTICQERRRRMMCGSSSVSGRARRRLDIVFHLICLRLLASS
ncbi:hypothetical protein Bca52824_043961 [Brassica carinata]|uniref:RecA family profile 1 domain-containing protein n=1 Tax=Brassica carinata TaxID=52824 RepID=A0A8X7S052_BRACI|nr:hypothetical protein Bca52824_043961 [Brassica carinata]